MAAVTLPPPGPAREFYCRVSPGRPPPDTPTDRAQRKSQVRRMLPGPCSPLLAPALATVAPRLPRLPRTRALRDYELHQLGSNQRPKSPRPERCTN